METSSWRGLYFHSWNDLREIVWQGRVLREIDSDRILVQLFSFLDGSESDQKIVKKDEAERWTFYGSAADMRNAYLFEEGIKAEASVDSKLELARSLSGGRTEKIQSNKESKDELLARLQAAWKPPAAPMKASRKSIEDLDDLELKKSFLVTFDEGRAYTKGCLWRSVTRQAYWKSAGKLRFDQSLDRLCEEDLPIISLVPQTKKKGPGRPSPVYVFNGKRGDAK